MYAIVEQDIFCHNSVIECQHEHDIMEWLKTLEKIHGKKYKIIKK